MLLVRFSFCEYGSVVCMSPRPAQRSVAASTANAVVASRAASTADRSFRPGRPAIEECIGWTSGMGNARATLTPARDNDNPAMATQAAPLLSRLSLAMARDAARLARRIDRARVQRASEPEWTRLAADVERSIAKCAARAAAKPAISYPADLPVAQRAEEIARAIREHQVVIVCGETGSGKTTQLPKICLAAGRGEKGLIGHTQPRRIAARAVATRIAHELGQPVGEAVGYKVRFTDQTHPDAYIKLMTDGILLAETQGDRQPRGLRHDHRRRSARTQPQHRLPAGLPQAALRQAARLESDRHVGHARRGSLRAALRHRRQVGAGHRGFRPRVSRRRALPAIAQEWRRERRRACERVRRRGGTRGSHRRHGRGPVARRPGRHPRIPAGRARDQGDRRPACAAGSRAVPMRRRSRSCRCSRGCRWPTSSESSRPATAAGSCSPPTSRKRRSRCRGFAT